MLIAKSRISPAGLIGLDAPPRGRELMRKIIGQFGQGMSAVRAVGRLGQQLELADALGALAQRGAEAVGAGVAAAEDDHVLVLGA